jgi:hypothetical protein
MKEDNFQSETSTVERPKTGLDLYFLSSLPLSLEWKNLVWLPKRQILATTIAKTTAQQDKRRGKVVYR